MDLRSGYAFWPIQDGLIATYPPLKEDITCEVAIIGGGITGALLAYYLGEAGLDTVVIEKRDIATGSTAASTALLQYEVDTHLIDLINKVGRPRAERSYRLCHDAILTLEALVQKLAIPCSFERKQSLYLASQSQDVTTLQYECAARQAIGIEVDFLSQADLKRQCGLDAPAALLSHTAAQTNTYRLTHALLQAAPHVRVYDRTTVTAYTHAADQVQLHTDRGATIQARYIVFAAGYETQQYLRDQVTTFHSTYALITEPVEHFAAWQASQYVLWETARPYFYLRTTPDGRVIMGGEDDDTDDPVLRVQHLPHKTAALVNRFQQLFPQIEIEVAYTWAGTFGETADGLAYIGPHRDFPRAYFALGYGGNGITYSVIAAEIIRDLLLGHHNPDAEVFSFERSLT